MYRPILPSHVLLSVMATFFSCIDTVTERVRNLYTYVFSSRRIERNDRWEPLRELLCDDADVGSREVRGVGEKASGTGVRARSVSGMA